MKVAFFDFDGTITKSDTLFQFIRFSKGNPKFYAGIVVLAPFFLFLKLGLIANWRAKEILLSWYFKGIAEPDFIKAGEKFSKDIIPQIIRPEAQRAIDFHLKEKDLIVVVTASLSVWVKPWCDDHGIVIIATEPEIVEGRFTGLIKGENCHGIEKVRRIKAAYDLSVFDKIYAYGDSSSDIQMLNLADEKYLKWQKIK